jgi:hypothetical protein
MYFMKKNKLILDLVENRIIIDGKEIKFSKLKVDDSIDGGVQISMKKG